MNYFSQNNPSTGGQNGNALIMMMVLFVFTSLSVGLGLTVPVIKANRIATGNIESKKSTKN